MMFPQSGSQAARVTSIGLALIRVLLLLALSMPAGLAQTDAGTETCRSIEVFTRPGCPHCARAKEFLQALELAEPSLQITERVVTADQFQLERLLRLSAEHGIQRPGVPTFLICETFLVGFDTDRTTGEVIRGRLGLTAPAPGPPPESVSTSWFGIISAGELGLPLFTIIIGLIDGFNPCAMWVLLMLLSLLVNLRSRKRLLLIAGTFVLVSGAVYYAFMAAWLNLYLIIGLSRSIQVIIGLVALLIGAVHIKDFLALHRGVSLSIPDSAKPGIYTRIRRVMYAENLAAAILAVMTVAVLVNLVELLCTAGLPALYTQILAARGLPAAAYYSYLLLYNLAYIFDDTLMVGIAVFTLSSRKMQAVEGRWLKLLSGAVILLLGTVMLLAPDWLV
jgi:glutaredoxin